MGPQRQGERAVAEAAEGSGPGVPARMLPALALAYAVAPLATDMYLPSLPRVTRELGIRAAGAQMTLTAFMLGLAVGQLVIGPLSDRWGRRRLLLAGTATCAAAGVLCAVAPTIEVLVAGRLLQGLSGAAGIVIARAVIGDLAKGSEAVRSFSVLVVIGGVAPVVAPLAGGALAGPVGWRGIFLVLAGLAVLMFLGALLLVPETLPPQRRHSGGLATTVRGSGALLADRGYLGHALAYGFGFGALFSYIAASPFVFQGVYGLSTGDFALLFAVNAFGFTGTGAVNRRIVGRFGARPLLRIGLRAMAAFSAPLCLLALAGRLPFAAAAVLVFLTVASLGLVAANATALATARAPGAAGSASAVLGALQYALGALVAPLVGLGGDATAVPMALAMCASVCVAATGGLWVAGRVPQQSLSEP